MSRYGNAPPPYEEVVSVATPSYVQQPWVPPRYFAPTEGRNSIVYDQFPTCYDTTKLFLVDNKSADITDLNMQNDHSHFATTVVQNSEFTPREASTQHITLDNRSRWGAKLKTLIQTNLPSVTDYMYTNSLRVKLMESYDEATGTATYEWHDITLPEGNFDSGRIIDLLNNAIWELYLTYGRQNGVREDQIGIKFDTRNFRLGFDPLTNLIMPGHYTYEYFHPDIVLMKGCAVDFSKTRLNNVLGWRKRYPYQPGFVITYDDLVGGDIPPLLDLAAYLKKPREGAGGPIIRALQKDSKGRSYHVQYTDLGEVTGYRSLYLAYNYTSDVTHLRKSTVRSWLVLTAPDITGGAQQLYWSLPDMALAPTTFRPSGQTPATFPVVSTEPLPIAARTIFNAQPGYAQIVNQNTSQTMVYNRFPENAILMRPPQPFMVQVPENVTTVTDHGTLPLQNTLSGVQRVAVTDSRRRTCPYVYKCAATLEPHIMSSRTLQ
ncbi:III [Murine mastadenovirus A]|uniref:Penton protein n=1 Tax=Murine adenovirus A serotype 1 TaxID=10530 RepID=CAPSP_ADEM1|nr:penton base protein [Murine mastadenovirus A]AP_000346.1 III [Murine mastadenovirus A]O10439.1 RecName: Full=Penton protein; Short=CP-P; AltName: Full=Penton base protein; AltName: Full=Protein III [Murine adenovirus 1]AAB53754.1 III [Murine adenovirus 1]